MANTSYLRREVEDYVRTVLSERHGRAFAARPLKLRTGGMHEFDCVSSDGSIVASVKSASGLTASGKNPSGKIKDSLAELYYLSLVEAPVRLLVLTTPSFYDIFTKVARGAIAEGIAVECISLPDAIQAEVDKVVRLASAEVTPALASAAVPTEVETGDPEDLSPRR
jgi:hypothetical protein